MNLFRVYGIAAAIVISRTDDFLYPGNLYFAVTESPLWGIDEVPEKLFVYITNHLLDRHKMKATIL